MRNGRKRIFIGAVLALVLMLTQMALPTPAEAKAKISDKSIVLLTGKYRYLLVSGSDYPVTWSSSNKKVATVGKKTGKVTAKKKGKAVITAKSGKKKYTCKVRVEDPKISQMKITIEQGDSYQLKVTGTTKNVSWRSSGYDYLDVSDNGKVTGKYAGTEPVYAVVGDDERFLKCEVTVVEKNVSESSLEKKIYSYEKGVAAVIKNNNDFMVDIKGDVVFKDAAGNAITHSSDDNDRLEAGQTCVLIMSYYTDSDKSYSTYDISISATQSNIPATQNCKNISFTSSKGEDSVIATFKNNGTDKYDFIQATVVYFDAAGNCLGADYRYTECNNPGSTDICDFPFPYDREYNTITPASYEIYVDYCD